MDWFAPEGIVSKRLTLEPLAVGHAAEMVRVLSAPTIYDYIGGDPPSLEQLERRYARQAEGHSADGSQGWLNWIIRRQHNLEAIGFVQATLENDDGALVAGIAWVVAPARQGQGFASEATGAMLQWLRAKGVRRFAAYINPGHRASIGVARRQGLRATTTIVEGEVLWTS